MSIFRTSKCNVCSSLDESINVNMVGCDSCLKNMVQFSDHEDVNELAVAQGWRVSVDAEKQMHECPVCVTGHREISDEH